ncbi:MAG: hypothetical protein ACTSU3_01650 [Candidatus Thorarchaeota archaeon]
MSFDVELEKLAVEQKLSLTKEFADKFADLRERTRRVPIDLAKQIAEEKHCPLQIAMVAYLIDLDGILSIRDAIDALVTELRRLDEIEKGVPNLPGNIQEFAIAEGRWISHIYGTFAQRMEVKVREIANMESTLDETELTVEKAMSIFTTRTKVAEAFILPVVQNWLTNHENTNGEDVLTAFGPAITGWKLSTIRGKMIQMRRRNQAFYRKLRSVIASDSSSAMVEGFVKRLDTIITEFDKPLNKMNETSTAHLILHFAPRPIGARGDRSSYVRIGTASSRGNKTEPDMASPYDFLERDVRLAKRRSGDDREIFLLERISRVLRVLRYQGSDMKECVEKCITELEERMGLDPIPKEMLMLEAEAMISSVSEEGQNQAAGKAVFQFVDKYIFGAGE